jgi:hypothetical protein
MKGHAAPSIPACLLLCAVIFDIFSSHPVVKMSLEIEVEQLARFLFKDNVHDTTIELSLGGIEDNKDLFYFCLDLFCKGLVFNYGTGNKLVVNNITKEQFETIKTKMANAGINAHLDVIVKDKPEGMGTDTNGSVDDLPESALYPNVNIEKLELMPNSLDLTDYKFEINLNPTLSYVISFNLFHKVT